MNPACPLCHIPMGSFRPGADRRLYHACPSCGWILLDPSHHLSLEAQRERYLQHENNPENAGYVEMFRKFLRACVTLFAGKGGRALDLGCGPGPVLAGLLREAGHPTEIFDPIFFPEEPKGNLGLLTCTEVLEHLPDPLATFQPWVERLDAGGILAGMTLFHPDDPAKFGEWFYRRDPTHVSFYIPKTLEALARALGLSLKFTDGTRYFVLEK